MANAAAVIGLTYAGTSVQDGTIGLFLEIRRGLNEIAEVRGKDTVIPSAVGRRLRNRVRDRRVIELFGYVMGNGTGEAVQRADFRGLVDTLQGLFDPTTSAALVATLENGGTATIAARTVNMVWGNEKLPALRSVSIELESVDPEWVLTGS